MKNIVVVGSLNMDYVIEISYMPKVGETLSANKTSNVPGGKGANHAYAVGKLGSNVSMIGAVGNDDCGNKLIENLKSVSVNTCGVKVIENQPTGQAYITVESNGENTIIIVAGTNGLVNKELIQKNIELIEKSDIVIMQLEIPLETVEYVKEIAAEMGKTVIVDPAPAVSGLSESFWNGIDYIKPNKIELEILTYRELNTIDAIKDAAKEMLNKGVKNVIVTMGGDGCLLMTNEMEKIFPIKKVKAVDSFIGAFALALSQGKSCDDAILLGQKVSALVVTRKGAQTSIPTIDEVI